MGFTRILALAALLLPVIGCHSAYVAATVSNRTTQPIGLVEVDYPSASFGTQTLAPGADFHYRFKVLGTGFMKITYTDSARKEQSSKGPYLKEGAEGPVNITIAPDGIHWQTTIPPTAPPSE
jgi:hypothetical protein